MVEDKLNTMELLTFPLLEKEIKIQHFISTRHGGVSAGNYASLNLSVKVDDATDHIKENRKRVAGKLNIDTTNLVFPDQCHTDTVQIIRNSWNSTELKKTDALITNERGICLCVLTADCVPVLLYDRNKRVIAAVHAGWKGTASRIVSRTVERMIKVFATKPRDIVAGIGPAISQPRYEVGDEVATQFHFLFHDHPEILWKNPKTGKLHIDLQLSNRILLLRAGLTQEQIETMNICTFDNPDLFFSARRDGIMCGRFCAGIMLIKNGRI